MHLMLVVFYTEFLFILMCSEMFLIWVNTQNLAKLSVHQVPKEVSYVSNNLISSSKILNQSLRVVNKTKLKHWVFLFH